MKVSCRRMHFLAAWGRSSTVKCVFIVAAILRDVFHPRSSTATSVSNPAAIPHTRLPTVALFPSFPSFPVQLSTCKLLRGHSASVARVWRYRNLIITVITIISCAPITSTDKQTNARQLRRQLQLRFDSHSTAIRPRYDNSTIRRPMLQSQPTYLWAAACGECK